MPTAEDQKSNDETVSKYILNQQEHNLKDISIRKLQAKAIEVNSADEVRQAIKGVLTGKALVIHTDETNLITLADEPRSTQDNTKTPLIESQRNDSATLVTDQDSKVQSSSTHQNHPESPQHEPERDNTKKRGSRPPKAGPAKRRKSKKKTEDLYSGKLSNVVAFKNSNLVTRKR